MKLFSQPILRMIENYKVTQSECIHPHEKLFPQVGVAQPVPDFKGLKTQKYGQVMPD